MIDDAGAWISEQLPEIEIPGLDLTGKQGVLPMNVEMIDGWVMFRSQDGKPATVKPDVERKN
ncbi:MAG: hypothetical protein SH868_05385 [Bythopirellula sp.]|nr:hypothetical protein [Bythopirellula sp.]